MITRDFNLTLRIPEQDSMASAFRVVQNDNSVYSLTIKLTDGINEIDYGQIDHAHIIFLKADGNVVQGSLTIDTDSLSYTMGTNEIAHPGAVLASVQLYGAGNERLTTARFKFDVVRDLSSPSAIESSTEYDALTKAILMMEDLEQRLTDFPNIKVLGTYPTLADLQAAHPSGAGLEGGYFITSNGEFYIWSTATSAWESLGTIKGPQGDPGPKGDKPAHQWSGTSLQLENPDGTWGDSVDLKGQDGTGSGDMSKAVYDTDGDGKVNAADNADKVNGFAVETNVPADAKFTDTIYDDTEIKQDLASHKPQTASLTELGHVQHGIYTATLLSTAWVGTVAPYSQALAITGVLATDKPIADIVPTGIYDTDKQMETDWANVYRIATSADTVTFYAHEVPKANIPVQLGVTR